MRLNRISYCQKLSQRYLCSKRAVDQYSGSRRNNVLIGGKVGHCPSNHFTSYRCNGLIDSTITGLVSQLQPSTCFSTSILRCMAGHSHWANIKFKKMHKDVERSKKFGKLSLEIISAVKEDGPDPMSNSKLDSIISRAKAVKMPKDSIESAIKSALRAGTEAQTQALLEVRGPGRCGLLLDILTANLKRMKPEIITILKKNGGKLSEGGSVSFMFQHKGVITLEGIIDNQENTSKVEDMAILCGAEEFFFENDEDGKSLLRFICAPLDLGNVRESLESDYNVTISSASEERMAVKLVDLDESQMTQADRLIDLLNAHPDVMRIFDNIRYYPSATLKHDIVL